MKKRNMLPLALALCLLPAVGSAQDLPELFAQMSQSATAGLAQGAALAEQSLTQDLTLALDTDAPRVEAGRSVTLTIAAGNPMAVPAEVTIALELPEHLRAAGETTIHAVLPAAQLDEAGGALLPSTTTFTRVLTLEEKAQSASAQITCEMAMGTRFYRMQTPISLCVPDVRVRASAEGLKAGRVQPGDAFEYCIEIVNAGDAPKDVALELALPEGIAPQGEIEGFARQGQALRGVVHAMAANADAPSVLALRLPMAVSADALAGDSDQRRLIAGTLRADGERVALPRIELCDALITAKLQTQTDSLALGEETELSVVVVNSGLAAADVQLSCLLPQGLLLAGGEDDGEEDEATPDEGVVPPGGEGPSGTGLAVPADGAQLTAPAMTMQDRTLVFDVHMDAAGMQDGGVIASTQVVKIPVVADAAQEELTDRLLGASLAWSVDGEAAQLADTAALRVYREAFMGMTRADVNGLFWAGVLLTAMVVCLCAAVRRDHAQSDFCCE